MQQKNILQHRGTGKLPAITEKISMILPQHIIIRNCYFQTLTAPSRLLEIKSLWFSWTDAIDRMQSR